MTDNLPMTTTTTTTTTMTPLQEGLALHMATALDLYATASSHELTGPDGVELVHDLRVAVRRCRSLAQGLADVDVAERKLWRRLSQAGRPLFSGLGALRDAQVMREWVVALVGDDVGAGVIAAIDDDIAARVGDARVAVAAFDVAAWQSLMVAAPPRARQMLGRRPALMWLAMTRLEQARQSHILAMRRRSAEALHDVRIAVKRFRYCLESLLPSLHGGVSKVLKKLQDVLGEIHDLDVLVDRVVAHGAQSGADVGVVVDAIAVARAERLAAYKAVATGRHTVWSTLRRVLPQRADAVARCRRAYLLEVADAAGADAAAIRRCERALKVLSASQGLPLTPGLLDAAVLAHGRRRRRRRLLRRPLLGISSDEARVIRAQLKMPLIVAARVATAAASQRKMKEIQAHSQVFPTT